MEAGAFFAFKKIIALVATPLSATFFGGSVVNYCVETLQRAMVCTVWYRRAACSLCNGNPSVQC